MRLSTIKNSQNQFCLLDFSKTTQLLQTLGLENNNQQHSRRLETIAAYLMHHLSAEVSAVVVDPHATFSAIAKKMNGTGLVLPVEKHTPLVEKHDLPKLADNWGIEHISNNYAVAKLELYYHPSEPEAMRKKQFVAEVYDYCKYEGIDLILELLVYHDGENAQANADASAQANADDSELLLETQLQAVREFTNSCDIFALEYLGSTLSAVTLTAELDTPWIYSAQDVGYEVFKQNLRSCIESGARGFLAGAPFWTGSKTRSVLGLPDQEALSRAQDGNAEQEYITTEIRDKVIESVRIVGEA